MEISIQTIAPTEVDLMNALLDTFSVAFEDAPNYSSNRPGSDYLQSLLASDHFIAMAARVDGVIAGGLAAYELRKFEQERSEIYLYDLAVAREHRRKGVATALIQELRQTAARRGAYVIFVQADTGPEDEPAIALYERHGTREEVLHFDIEAEPGRKNTQEVEE